MKTLKAIVLASAILAAASTAGCITLGPSSDYQKDYNADRSNTPSSNKEFMEREYSSILSRMLLGL